MHDLLWSTCRDVDAIERQVLAIKEVQVRLMVECQIANIQARKERCICTSVNIKLLDAKVCTNQCVACIHPDGISRVGVTHAIKLRR